MSSEPNRSCGSCHACCIHLDIDSLRKPAHKRCPHLMHAGCIIYYERPHECRGFLCLWRLGVVAERPDEVGVLAHLAKNEATHWFGVNVIETRRGALAKARSVIDQCLALDCACVEAEYLDGRRYIWSQHERWIDDLRRRNPDAGIPPNVARVEIRVRSNGRSNMSMWLKEEGKQ